MFFACELLEDAYERAVIKTQEEPEEAAISKAEAYVEELREEIYSDIYKDFYDQEYHDRLEDNLQLYLSDLADELKSSEEYPFIGPKARGLEMIALFIGELLWTDQFKHMDVSRISSTGDRQGTA